MVAPALDVELVEDEGRQLREVLQRLLLGPRWGLPTEQVNSTTGCPGSPNFPSPPPFNLFPGVYKKQKKAGDIVITFCKPSPWDGGGGWR